MLNDMLIVYFAFLAFLAGVMFLLYAVIHDFKYVSAELALAEFLIFPAGIARGIWLSLE